MTILEPINSFKDFVKILNRSESNISFQRRTDMKQAYFAGMSSAIYFFQELLEKGYELEEILEAIREKKAELFLTPFEL